MSVNFFFSFSFFPSCRPSITRPNFLGYSMISTIGSWPRRALPPSPFFAGWNADGTFSLFGSAFAIWVFPFFFVREWDPLFLFSGVLPPFQRPHPSPPSLSFLSMRVLIPFFFSWVCPDKCAPPSEVSPAYERAFFSLFGTSPPGAVRNLGIFPLPPTLQGRTKPAFTCACFSTPGSHRDD